MLVDKWQVDHTVCVLGHISLLIKNIESDENATYPEKAFIICSQLDDENKNVIDWLSDNANQQIFSRCQASKCLITA